MQTAMLSAVANPHLLPGDPDPRAARDRNFPDEHPDVTVGGDRGAAGFFLRAAGRQIRDVM